MVSCIMYFTWTEIELHTKCDCDVCWTSSGHVFRFISSPNWRNTKFPLTKVMNWEKSVWPQINTCTTTTSTLHTVRKRVRDISVLFAFAYVIKRAETSPRQLRWWSLIEIFFLFSKKTPKSMKKEWKNCWTCFHNSFSVWHYRYRHCNILLRKSCLLFFVIIFFCLLWKVHHFDKLATCVHLRLKWMVQKMRPPIRRSTFLLQ